MNMVDQTNLISNFTTDEFVEWMLSQNLYRGYIINIDGSVLVSDQRFEEFALHITQSPDYLNHEGIFFEADAATKSLFIAAIHRTHRGSGQGGTRMKQYPYANDIFIDAIRLAKGMTDKNACAEIWWGGGKSVIHPPKHPRSLEPDLRKQIFTNFGLFIASLNGLYVCAEDMNTTPEDMRVIHANNRFCTCVPVDVGGSSNPSIFTARGVFKGILAGIHFNQGIDDQSTVDLKGKHIIVQGAGNVGWRVMEQAVAAGAKVTVFDISEHTKEKIRQQFSPQQVTIEEDGNKLYEIEADVFSPNAIGAIINDDTIERLNVKIIAGGANNQLQDPIKHAERLHERGILYVPDFIINRMGIVNCANEQYGYLLSSIEDELLKVYPFTQHLLKEAKVANQSPQFKALDLADELSRQPHPIWGHRGIKIIQQLLDNQWANK